MAQEVPSASATQAAISLPDPPESHGIAPVDQPLNRRRALRVLGALAAASAGAAAMLKGHSEPVEAANGDPLVLGTTNSATLRTELDVSAPSDFGFVVTNSNGAIAGAGTVGGGVFSGNNFGVFGNSPASGGTGIVGQGNGTGTGVYGTSPSNTGIFGGGALYGVFGTNSNGGPGVYGTSSGTGGSGSVGVFGASTQSGGVGVQGVSNVGTTATGVLGTTTTGFAAVQGTSSSKHGVYGTTSASDSTAGGVYGFNSFAGGNGVIGQADGSGSFGVWGRSTGGFAGYFTGSVFITGNITVLGGKSAAVPSSDGSLRRLYCVESPESWFEDFGSAQLSGGTANVQVKSDFAGVVKTDAYQVFLTAEGESNGLFVSAKSPGGFTVKEAGGGTGSIGFSYRIVAKRKDIAGPRLEAVQAPDRTLPEPPALNLPVTPPPTPKAPALPALPGIPSIPGIPPVAGRGG